MARDNLAFLDNLLGSRKDFYRESKWLVSDFDCDIWCFKFEGINTIRFQIDFNKTLSNGTLLTDKQNSRLLNTFKYWINASVHPDNTRGRGLSYTGGYAKNLISGATSIIDYFLLNDKHLKISSYGLQAITQDHLKHFAERQAAMKWVAECVYGWSERLSEFLINQVVSSDKDELLNIMKSSDVGFSVITDNQLEFNKLEIPIELIPLVRCWLWKNNFYHSDYCDEYMYSVNTALFSARLYEKTTLRGAATNKPRHHILWLGVNYDFRREFRGVPVTNGNKDVISPTTMSRFKVAMRALLLLRDEVFSDEDLLLPPDDAINEYLDYLPENMASNRFISLPSKIVFTAVRSAIEFHLRYADALYKSLANILALFAERRQQLQEGQRDSISKVIDEIEFSKLIHPVLQKLGVEKWTISKSKNRFEALRDNKGLCELIRVYYGGVAIVVGALMARREIELITLKAKDCLDESKRYLIFSNAKSTQYLDGLRVTVARPIDEIAVEMIEKLIEFQRLYIEHNFINEMGNLFDTVSSRNASKLLSATQNRRVFPQNIDVFCDYFEMPLRDGKRYYIRTHQLRRFFALSFFWGSGFGGMDTLRWFMGHTDVQHLYHYITENSPGEVLRHAKSQFLTETIEEHAELRTLISERYGTDDFTVLNTDELEAYINELIVNEDVDLEPEFIEDNNGQSYRLLVIVRDKNNGR